MTSAALAALTGGTPVHEFVDDFVVDASPHVFADRRAYHSWRRAVAPMLDVDPAGLHVVGSAVVGFSLTPGKSMAPFGAGSDIDVAVVSAYHFDVAWRTLRSIRAGGYKLPSRYRQSVRWHAPNDVFSGCIATDIILPILPFREAWMTARTSPAVIDPVGGREVNFRLYRDLDGLRSYQNRSVRALYQENGWI